jgi:hypothetical protein
MHLISLPLAMILILGKKLRILSSSELFVPKKTTGSISSRKITISVIKPNKN